MWFVLSDVTTVSAVSVDVNDTPCSASCIDLFDWSCCTCFRKQRQFFVAFLVYQQVEELSATNNLQAEVSLQQHERSYLRQELDEARHSASSSSLIAVNIMSPRDPLGQPKGTITQVGTAQKEQPLRCPSKCHFQTVLSYHHECTLLYILASPDSGPKIRWKGHMEAPDAETSRLWISRF